MKIYISGAITNNPNYKKDFERAEDYLQREYPSADIINPALVNSFLPKSTRTKNILKCAFVCWIWQAVSICYRIMRTQKVRVWNTAMPWQRI